MHRNRLRHTAPAFILITFYGAVQSVPTSVQPSPDVPARAQSPLAPAANTTVDVVAERQDALRTRLDAQPN